MVERCYMHFALPIASHSSTRSYISRSLSGRGALWLYARVRAPTAGYSAAAPVSSQAVDFDGFFGAFLPRLVQSSAGLSDAQKHELGKQFGTEKDAPTFGRNVLVFVNDLALFRQANT
jgi:hypothetical protein